MTNLVRKRSMTKAQYGTPDYYRGVMREIEERKEQTLESGSFGAYSFGYGELLVTLKDCIAHLESATASQACRPGCKYIQGHSGPCIERDLDAEVNAGKWGPPGSGLAEFVESNKVGCANAIDPNKWGEPPFYHVTGDDPEFVNVNHE